MQLTLKLPLRALLLSLACAAGLASALPAAAADPGWTQYGESESAVYSYDRGTLRTDRQRRLVWRMFEHKAQPDPDAVASGKALIEIDCRNRTYRYLKTIYYSDKGGKGRYLGGIGPQKGDHIAPGTMIGQLAEAVCQQPGS